MLPIRSSRRQFLQSTAIAAGVGSLTSWHRSARAAELEQVRDLDVRIDRVLNCRVHYERPRMVAGNSGYRLAGKHRSDSVLAVFGNNGQIGVGSCRGEANIEKARFLLGKTIADLLDHAVEVNHRTGTSAIWDLAGKTADRPVYQLLNGTAPVTEVPVYDGSIYHEELLSRDSNSAYRNPGAKYGAKATWADIIKEAIDGARNHGHDFVKVKIGRGHMHLSRNAGNLQDAAVLELIREYGGDDFGIGVDANNGYRLEDTIWLLREYGQLNLAFVEEMFPDDPAKYRHVRNLLAERKLKTLIADGESWRGPDDSLALKMIDSGTVDVLQGDMRQFEIEGILAESRLAAAAGHGSRIAPHNWGSQFGFYMQIHVACAIPNFYRAEHDPGKPVDDTLVHRGYTIANGHCTDFDAPGFGIELNRKKLDTLQKGFDIRT